MTTPRFTPFTTLATFNANTALQGTGLYTGLSITGGTPSPLNRTTQTGTSYNYVADATPAGTFFGGGSFTVMVLDSLGDTASLTLTPSAIGTGSFAGWRSTGTITRLTVTSLQPSTGPVWPSVDNTVLAVPEPGTYAMLLAGLGVVGFMARRRRA